MAAKRLISLAFSLAAISCGDNAPNKGVVSDRGLFSRPDNSQCLATRFQQPAAIKLKRILPEQDFDRPLGLVTIPGNDDVLYVLQQDGVIWRLAREVNGYSTSKFVDLGDFYNIAYLPHECFECGLLGMAFHPDFADSGYVYVSFTEGGEHDPPVHSHVKRFRSDDGGLTLARVSDDPTSLVNDTIYHIEQPDLTHNGGHLAFGPDGYLYVGFGDGGLRAQRRFNHSQDTSNPLGTLLRLTDDGDPAPGNEVDGGLPEIYAYGLRNPWKWSFDHDTGDLWLGDAGQAHTEEVNIIVNGGNYGWMCYEGRERFTSCGGDDGPFIDPIIDYGHTEGQAVIGGYVYRGSGLPELQGTYIYGDFGSGVVWGLTPQDDDYQHTRLLASGKSISAFGEDNSGELYVIDHAGGGLYQIVPTDKDDLEPLPAQLSATGCVNPEDPTRPAEGLIPYTVNEPFWSDNAEKERFIALPNDAQIDVKDDGDFELPVGTVLVENFRLSGRVIETRLLLRQPHVEWSGYSYQWNEQQTEATLLTGTASAPIGDQVWHYPSRAECTQCHTAAAGDSLGLEARQLNTDFTYPSTGLTANQLDTFEALGLFTAPLDNHVRAMTMPNSRDASAPLDDRARSYLHSNCAGCHRSDGITQSTMDLRFNASFMNLCNKPPLSGSLGLGVMHLMTPGEPEKSIIWHRLDSDSEHRMPPIASNLVDRESADLIYEWIESLDACETVLGPVGATYTIRNRVTGDYIHAQDGIAQAGGIQRDSKAAQWRIEAFERPSIFRIRSHDNPEHFLHTEQLPVRSGTIEEGWWSAQWKIVPEGEYVTIRNRHSADPYLYMKNGELQLGTKDTADLTIHWEVEQVD